MISGLTAVELRKDSQKPNPLRTKRQRASGKLLPDLLRLISRRDNLSAALQDSVSGQQASDFGFEGGKTRNMRRQRDKPELHGRLRHISLIMIH